MEKHLVTFEFRYKGTPKNELYSEHKNKTITIGVFDTIEEAIEKGNESLLVFEKHFKIHVYPKGNEAKRERFSKNGGCFGSSNTLVSNLAYLQTPFTFYGKITKLNYADVDDTINEVLTSIKNYKLNKTLT